MSATTDTLSVYSMFAGIGGIDLGLENTGGFETVAFSEIDPYASKVLKKHWPDVPNVGDCTTVQYEVNKNGTTYFEQADTGEGHWLPPIDVLVAGFPCQDISVAGKQKGIQDDTRSGLWHEVTRAASNLRPRYLLLENVAAITTNNAGRDYATVLGDLASMGFDARWGVLRASDFGFPHQRKRWFAIAHTVRQRTQVPAEGQQPAITEFGSEGATNGNSGRFQWSAEPRMGGSDDGLPYWTHPDDEREVILSPHSTDGKKNRWDRMRCLGNAVVPQVAQYVGECLLKLEGRQGR